MSTRDTTASLSSEGGGSQESEEQTERDDNETVEEMEEEEGTPGLLHIVTPDRLREIGHQATWSVSSCKLGFDVAKLTDDSVDTYWQSDGLPPHLVSMQFQRKLKVEGVWIYLKYSRDKSYTPNRISVRSGTHFNDLQEIKVVDFVKPNGWFFIPLNDVSEFPFRTFMLQLAILTNHDYGQDARIRQMKIHSPVEMPVVAIDCQGSFTSPTFKMYSYIR
ncbi:anaphase-promoting complex subunit 10-like [Palaemon carinicauda]|uniref:anaphase-promoting complex subunit 10-like n=1 Tax=Palaemon carinicauda TaxID=392227 RepID=UPI0035B6888E